MTTILALATLAVCGLLGMFFAGTACRIERAWTPSGWSVNWPRGDEWLYLALVEAPCVLGAALALMVLL